jgi:hypothetical protein
MIAQPFLTFANEFLRLGCAQAHRGAESEREADRDHMAQGGVQRGR